MEYGDIIMSRNAGVATITINRPDALNALRSNTYAEIVTALSDVGWDNKIGVVVLTGTGSKAFCIGGDGAEPKSSRKGRGTIGVPLEEIHSLIRDIPKPVIAKVRGFAIGGGNVLATICDLTLAADTAVFGQVGPKVGSVDPGFGTAYLAHVVGEKRAREFWYLCRRYPAQEAHEMGLVNKVVPEAELDAEVDSWCQEILAKSPTAIAIAKRSFNAATENIRGIAQLGFEAVNLYYGTDEAKETAAAFKEHRRPNFYGDQKG